jgi:hypothetical protein
MKVGDKVEVVKDNGGCQHFNHIEMKGWVGTITGQLKGTDCFFNVSFPSCESCSCVSCAWGKKELILKQEQNIKTEPDIFQEIPKAIGTDLIRRDAVRNIVHSKLRKLEESNIYAGQTIEDLRQIAVLIEKVWK